jgi:hypothetical protein
MDSSKKASKFVGSTIGGGMKILFRTSVRIIQISETKEEAKGYWSLLEY